MGLNHVTKVATQNLHREHEEICLGALCFLKKIQHNSDCMRSRAILLYPGLANTVNHEKGTKSL